MRLCRPFTARRRTRDGDRSLVDSRHIRTSLEQETQWTQKASLSTLGPLGALKLNRSRSSGALSMETMRTLSNGGGCDSWGCPHRSSPRSSSGAPRVDSAAVGVAAAALAVVHLLLPAGLGTIAVALCRAHLALARSVFALHGSPPRNGGMQYSGRAFESDSGGRRRVLAPVSHVQSHVPHCVHVSYRHSFRYCVC